MNNSNLNPGCEKASKGRKFAVKVSSPAQCKRLLSLVIPVEEVKKEEDQIFKKLRSDLKIPGFRKGKVPPEFIKKNYGEVIHSDAVRNLLPAVYEEALEREGIAPLGEPNFENIKAEKDTDISADIAVEVRPEVRIGKYKDLSVKAEKHEIGDSDIDEAMQSIRERMASFRVVEREAGENDYLVIDYAPIINGEIDRKKLLKNYPVDMSSDNLLPDFRDGLKGVKPGDKKEFTVHYPADFPEKELKGQDRDFHVEVREVKEKVLPELNDDFVKQLDSGLTSVAELKKRVREDLIEQEIKRYAHEIEEKVIDVIIKNEPFEVPEAMVNNYLASVLEEDKKRRPRVDDEEAREKEVRNLFHDSAVRTVRKYFIMESVRVQENIKISDEELSGRMDKLAGTSERKDEILGYLRSPDQKSRIEAELADEKVLKLLRESADIKKV